MERDLQTAHERERFMRELEAASSSRKPRSGSGPSPSAVPSLAPSSHASVNAIQRLQDMSDYLVGFGLILLTLGCVTGIVLAFSDLAGVWRAFGFLACTLTGVFIFIFLKCVADAMRALADVGDLGRSLEHRLQALQERLEQEFSEP